MTGNTSNNNLSHKLKLPFKAYTGDEPYIFISYKHADSDIVYPIIRQLHDMGFNIWYDAALAYGKNYDIQIANKIKNSSLFVNFITKTSMACANDEEDYMIKEFSIARNFKKDILPIYLDDIDLDGFYLVHLLGKQSIFKHEYDNNDDLFIKACVDAFVNDFNIKRNDKNAVDFPQTNEYAQRNTAIEDSRLTSEYLKEFEKLNTTTESIFELGEYEVLLILKDGTNLTCWDDQVDKDEIIYLSEDLTDIKTLENRYKGLKSLKAIVTSPLPISITNLEGMFQGCSSLIDISTLENWNTVNVTKMRGMFKGCSSLKDISCLENWNTSQMTTIWSMFKGCSSLTDISSLKNWNTSRITTMLGMFKGCSSLTDISGLSDWNVSQVTNMASMFQGCSALRDLSSLEKWNTSQVTTMWSMFKGCSSLRDVSSIKCWITSQVTTMWAMFQGCSSLTDISSLEYWNAINITNMASMFQGCSSLRDISSLKNWNTTNVTDLAGMFQGCSSLRDVSSLENWNTENVTDMIGMFQGCSSLTDISGLKNWNTCQVNSMWSMFKGCSSLIDISSLQSWNTSNVSYMNCMFEDCSSIEDFSPLSDWDTLNANKEDMFANCKSLKTYPSWEQK